MKEKDCLALYGDYIDIEKKNKQIKDQISLSKEELECLEGKWRHKQEIIKEESPRIVFFALGNHDLSTHTNPKSPAGEN